MNPEIRPGDELDRYSDFEDKLKLLPAESWKFRSRKKFSEEDYSKVEGNKEMTEEEKTKVLHKMKTEIIYKEIIAVCHKCKRTGRFVLKL